MRVEVQVSAPPPARPVAAREPLPRDRIARVASTLSDSPLKETLERIAGLPAAKKKGSD